MDIRTIAENIGSLVGYSHRPDALAPLGTLVGISECGQYVTVDRGEDRGFPGSRYVVTLPESISHYPSAEAVAKYGSRERALEALHTAWCYGGLPTPTEKGV